MTHPAFIDVPMPVVTPRLLLRPLSIDDAEAVHAAKRESWTELAKWMIWTQKPLDQLTVKDDKVFCHDKQMKFLSRENLSILAFNRNSDRLIGGGGLTRCNWKQRIFIVGFWVRTSEIGKGHATEIGTALTHYAFNALKASRVFTLHAEGNNGSQKVIEKLGFKLEGILRKHHVLLDTVVDEYVYGLLDDKSLPQLDIGWGKPG